MRWQDLVATSRLLITTPHPNTQPLQDLGLFSPQVEQFADVFSQLQEQRHLADYDHGKTFSLDETIAWINLAEVAIESFMQTGADERKMVAIQSLIGRRAN